MTSCSSDESLFVTRHSKNSSLRRVACKPDSVRLSNADGHFSAAQIALSVVASLSKSNCIQPESSAGRVNAFCLDLHRARVANQSVTALTVGSLSDHFTLIAEVFFNEGLFSVALLSTQVASRRVAVSNCAALWCPDFPRRGLRLIGATIRPALHEKV